MRTRLTNAIFAMLLAALGARTAAAATVGERHLTAHEASATLRNASHADYLRITVWYPAAPGAVEAPLEVGPPGRPNFTSGSAARDAPFEDARPRPAILFSHAFGGSARIMRWFGTALARHGYVVVAVDHPRNNGRDPMTIGGALLYWERPGDLAAALETVKSYSSLSPHLDLDRLGVAGFSAGGFTSLVEAGALSIFNAFRIFAPPILPMACARRRRNLSSRAPTPNNFSPRRTWLPPSPTPRTISAYPASKPPSRWLRLLFRASIPKASSACGSRS